MTIMTEPDKIGNTIIFSIFILVMNCQYSFIGVFAFATDLRDFCSSKDISVNTFSTLPTFMFVSNVDLRISPLSLTGFATEELAAFWPALILQAFIGWFFTQITRYKCACVQCKMLTTIWAIFTPAPYYAVRLAIKTFIALLTVNCWHNHILIIYATWVNHGAKNLHNPTF